jgi:hypothetical protein
MKLVVSDESEGEGEKATVTCDMVISNIPHEQGPIQGYQHFLLSV